MGTAVHSVVGLNLRSFDIADRFANIIIVVLKGAIGGAGIAQLVVLGLAVHSVAGSILLWGNFR